MGKQMATGFLLAGIASAGLAGFGAVAAAWAGSEGDRPPGAPYERGGMRDGMHGRWNALSPEDRAAFTAARIAAIHAGLALNPDQEKLWPPVESAIRDLARQRQAQREARRTRGRMSDDAPGALRAMADAASARGDALRKLDDAATPLYASLDEAQKRRALVLARPMHRMGHGGHGGPGMRGRHGGMGDEGMGPGGMGPGGMEPGGDE